MEKIRIEPKLTDVLFNKSVINKKTFSITKNQECKSLVTNLAVRKRDPYLCAAGSFFFPGLGQVYCGKILRGIVFLIPAVLLTIPYGLVSLSIHFHWFEYSACWTYWTALISPVSTVIDFIVRVIATYDAYNIAKQTKTGNATENL